MHLDDGLRLLELVPQTGILPLQLSHALRLQVHRPGLAATLLGSQGRQSPGRALAAPPRQQRRIQTLASQQRADLPGLCTLLGFLQDLQLVLRRKPSAAGFRRHLRVWI